MYTLRPTEPKTEGAQRAPRNTWFTFTIVMIIAIVVGCPLGAALTYVGPPFQPGLSTESHSPKSPKSLAAQKAIAAQVELQAKEWNNGMVHVWSSLIESETTHIDVPESARCVRLDDLTYKLGSGSTAISYYKLACNGVVGYVERDQVR